LAFDLTFDVAFDRKLHGKPDTLISTLKGILFERDFIGNIAKICVNTF